MLFVDNFWDTYLRENSLQRVSNRTANCLLATDEKQVTNNKIKFVILVILLLTVIPAQILCGIPSRCTYLSTQIEIFRRYLHEITTIHHYRTLVERI